MFMQRGGNLNTNSFESKFHVNPKVALVFGVLTAIPQLFIIWAAWYLGASDLLLSWVIFAIVFSDIVLIVLAGYLLRSYLREDAFDWGAMLSNFVINSNNIPHFVGLASRMMNSARAEQKPVVQENWDDIVKIDMDLGDGGDEFD
jgi:hypothetical protein